MPSDSKGKGEERVNSVIRMLGLGMTTRAISTLLGVSPKTVEYHWAVAKSRFGFKSYVDAAHYALARGMIGNCQSLDDDVRERVNDA